MNEQHNTPLAPPSQHRPAALPEEAQRPLWPALLRGWSGRCPGCGGGPIFESYLTVRPSCAACGEALHHHRADDLPAWLTIIVVGHILAALLLFVENAFAPPLWVHWAAWPALTIGLTLWFLPRLKGSVVGMQWAWRMHGFGEAGE
ncbi:MAG: DUF983 domain-containing protein [Pseudomonadota bacterium]